MPLRYYLYVNIFSNLANLNRYTIAYIEMI